MKSVCIYNVSLDGYILSKCSSLNELVIIPSENNGISVVAIGDRAFNECTSLKRIFIPNTVKSIGVKAFSYCSKSITVYYGGTEEQWKSQVEMGNDVLSKLGTLHFNCDYTAEGLILKLANDGYILKDGNPSIKHLDIPLYCPVYFNIHFY